MQQDENTEVQNWPLQALREVCSVKRVIRGASSEKPQTVMASPGDVLLLQVGDQFRASVCDGSDLVIQGPYALITTSDKIMPEFLAMVLERKSFFGTVKTMCNHGSFGRNKLLLSIDIRDVLGRVNIGVPPMEEQALVVVHSEKYITHIQSLAANYRRLADTMDQLHLSMTGQMLQRKMDKKEIGALLSQFSRFLPAESKHRKEDQDQTPDKPRPAPSR